MAYAAASLWPSRSAFVRRTRARGFAAKCESKARKNAPALVAVTFNLAVVAFLGTFKFCAGDDGQQTIEATIEAFPEPLPRPSGGRGDGLPPLPTIFPPASAVPMPVLTFETDLPKFTVPAPQAIARLSRDPLGDGVFTRATTLSKYPSGTGTGGAAGDGKGDGINIGGMCMTFRKLGAIIDISGSMRPHCAEVSGALQKLDNEGKALRVFWNGCAISRYRDPFTQDIPFNVKVSEMILDGADAIFLFTDLQDPEEPEAVEELRKIILDAKVRFYVTSWDKRPSDALMEIIRHSGGSFLLKGKQHSSL